MTSEVWLPGALSVTVGVMLGLFFFAGLWWTVRRAVISPRPALWFIGSMLIRVAVTLVGFYWVSADQWWRLLLCTAGFIVARPLVSRSVNRPARDRREPCN
nr:ATP synthase subunit I [uncultured Desulfuromonas sp.]